MLSMSYYRQSDLKYLTFCTVKQKIEGSLYVPEPKFIKYYYTIKNKNAN